VRKPIKIILKVHGALALGIVVSAALFQEDPWLKKRVETLICQACEQAIGEPVSLTITKLDLFSGSITAQQVHSTSPSGSWSFNCPVLQINFSWLSFLKNSRLATELVFYKPVIYTKFEKGTFALTKPFLALVYAPLSLPLLIIRTDMQQATVVIGQAQGTIEARCSSSTDVKPEKVTTHCFVHEGFVEQRQDKRPLLESISGSLIIDVPVQQPEEYSIKTHLRGAFPWAKNSTHVFLSFYKQGHATLRCYPEDRSCSFQATDIVFEPEAALADVEISGSLSSLARYSQWGEVDLPGSVEGAGQIRISETGLHYSGTGQISGLNGPSLSCSVDGDSLQAQGTLLVEGPRDLRAEGIWKSSRGTFESSLALKKKYSGIPLTIDSGSCTLTMSGSSLKARATVQGQTSQGSKVRICANLESNRTEATLKGTCNTGAYRVQGTLFPFEVHQCSYRMGDKSLQLDRVNQVLGGTMSLDILRDLILLATGTSLQGSLAGLARVDITTEPGKIAAQIGTQEAAIKIPSLYNLITKVKGRLAYDYAHGWIEVDDLSIDLHKGRVWVPSARISLGAEGSLASAHVPIIAQGVFVGWNKDFFGTLSGGVTALFGQKRWSCKGLITLDKAQLNSNLLSSTVQKELMRCSGGSWTQECDLDVQFETQTPVEVKTSFFQTQAHATVTLGGTLSQPRVGGCIELLQGSFAFPYKPLYIISGKLFVSPEQMDDPAIELTARNTINTHTVTMHVGGTLHQPKVSFSASPHLTEESIVRLLLTGAEDGPLYLAMPSLVMMHIESLLFGSDENLSKAQQFFKNVLKHVKFIPSATEKGMQGAIEVNFTDRLRAKAQNAFNLSDQTQLEVEYKVSDDMRIKAKRDDKGSLGGEIEMRWKF
jgi:TamB, inner membrane protein subunit of TAM complex